MSNLDKMQTFLAAFAEKDVATVKAVMANDIIWRIPGHHPLAGPKHGVAEVMAFFDQLARADFKAQPLVIAESGDYVVDHHRGPGAALWRPLNYLFVEALERYHHFYGDDVKVECPTGSGKLMNLAEVSQELASRLRSIFLRDGTGRRACHGELAHWVTDPHWRELLLFHEYFHGENGKGLGASHQTGWTALAIRLIED